MIENVTQQVLTNMSWLTASEDVVLTVLGMNSLQINEVTLFRFLVQWGRARATEDAEARAIIAEGLKLIRFCAMSCSSFSTLCCQPLPLSNEEMLKILLSIMHRNTELLPEEFSISKWPRSLSTGCRMYMWNSLKATDCTVHSQTAPFTLKVVIDTPCYLTGVVLTSLTTNVGEQVQLTCDVYNPEHISAPMASATFKNTVQENRKGVLYLSWPVFMHPGIPYAIKLTYQHETERPTSMYANKGSFCWNCPDKTKFSVNLECHNDSIIDIYGLILGKEVVES